LFDQTEILAAVPEVGQETVVSLVVAGHVYLLDWPAIERSDRLRED